MSGKDQRLEMVRYWWSKARDSLASARREFEAGSYSFAMNRLYEGDYVVFVSFEPEYVRLQLEQCSELLDRLRKLLSSLDEAEG